MIRELRLERGKKIEWIKIIGFYRNLILGIDDFNNLCSFYLDRNVNDMINYQLINHRKVNIKNIIDEEKKYVIEIYARDILNIKEEDYFNYKKKIGGFINERR